MKILVITDIPSPYKVTFLEMMSKYHDIDVLFQSKRANDRDDAWYKDTSKLNCRYLNENKLVRFKELVSLNIKDYDVFWNLKYVAWECMLMAIRFRFHHKLNLMHADGGIYKDFGPILNFGMQKAMALNHYFTSSGLMTDEYYLGNNVKKDKIFHYHFSSVLAKDIEFADYKKTHDYDTKFELLSIGQPIHRKGFDVLLEAIVPMDNVHLTIIGGKANEECQTIIDKYSLENKVDLLPFRPFDELKKYYLNSDIFVFPTREDIWGLVLNEAMIFGLPIISTNNCVAAVEFEHQYNNCVCVNVDDVNGLRDTILKLMDDDTLRCSMAENSRKYANEVTINQMVKDYCGIFSTLEGLRQ